MLPAAQLGVGQQQFGMGYGLQGQQGVEGMLGRYGETMAAPLRQFEAMGGMEIGIKMLNNYDGLRLVGGMNDAPTHSSVIEVIFEKIRSEIERLTKMKGNDLIYWELFDLKNTTKEGKPIQIFSEEWKRFRDFAP